MQLLSNGGLVQVYRDPEAAKEMSAKMKGVRQGAMLFLLGAIIVPILGLIASYSSSNFPSILTALAAIICFMGGPLRMLFAALFEEGAPRPIMHNAHAFVPPPVSTPQFNRHGQNPALPPASVQPGAGWRGRPNTAELVNPPSVTENTTRLLDKEDHTKNQ
jgi:hypothetical protein